jgi:hypothetical protein
MQDLIIVAQTPAGGADTLPAVADSLPALVDRAVNALAHARCAAEVLEASALAAVAYHVASDVSRLARAKSASDDLISAAHGAMADSLELECRAQSRLAQEYDRAKQGGELGRQATATLKAVGVSPVQLFHARKIRDAEAKSPGLVRRVLNVALEQKQAPLKSLLFRAIRDATATPKARSAPSAAPTPAAVVKCRAAMRQAVQKHSRVMNEAQLLVLFGELGAELLRLKAAALAAIAKANTSAARAADANDLTTALSNH